MIRPDRGPTAAAEGSAWSEFVRARSAYARALASVVEQGVARRDTDHAVFNGCYDWHSCVHGCYSLFVAARLTGEPRWRAAAESRLEPRLLAEELDALRAGHLDHEVPYGLAWLLLLTRTRERDGGDDRLRPLAEEAAGRLVAWIGGLGGPQVVETARHREYRNLSWAVFNLAGWANWIGDGRTAAFLRDVTARVLLPLVARPVPDEDHSDEGFFPPRLMRIQTVLRVLGHDASRAALAEVVRNFAEPDPIRTPPSIHAAGLNFSRCWGYWTLYRHTRDIRFRQAFRRAFMTHLSAPAYWRDHYDYAHWVPQFGMHALGLSVEPPVRRSDEPVIDAPGAAERA